MELEPLSLSGGGGSSASQGAGTTPFTTLPGFDVVPLYYQTRIMINGASGESPR